MTDLTDRMRTCAAAMLYEAGPGETEMQWQEIYRDAADLLIEASNALEACEATGEACVPLGEPMEVIPPVTVQSLTELIDWSLDVPGTWIAPGGPLPGAAQMRPPRACPKCDSRANKTVRRMANTLVLVCPVCAHAWPYTKKPPAGGTASGQD